jgi:hypothetical protein
MTASGEVAWVAKRQVHSHQEKLQSSLVSEKDMSFRLCLPVALLILVTAVAVRTDEVGKPSPTRVKEVDTATHIVEGQVTGVYRATTTKGPEHVDTEFVIELTVEKLAKGDEIKTGTVLYARGWQSAKRPEGFVGSRGQAEIPNVGAHGDFYLRKDKIGRYDLTVPNGFQGPSVPTSPVEKP